MYRLNRISKFFVDSAITTFLWLYFLFGYSLIFIPIVLVLSPFSKNREMLFQKINHYYYRFFFTLLAAITPGLSLHIPDGIRCLKSCVVIANHRSYLDPLLMISLFARQRTIVKGVFFRVPIMRWVLSASGYIPFDQSGEFTENMSRGIREMDDFFDEGGVLFIFPEGRRNRSAGIGNMQKGAFSIAVRYNLPVEILYLENTDRIFTPGKFLFNTCVDNNLRVEHLGSITPEMDFYGRSGPMRDEAVRLYAKRIMKGHGSARQR